MAAWPQDVQSQLYRDLRDLEPEFLSGEPEEVEAYLSRKSEWFGRYIAASRFLRAQPIAPAPRPVGRPPKT